MSHESEPPHSHHGHTRIIGPDEDGFEWPRVERGDDHHHPRYAHHPQTHDTTHRYPDGHYYTIKQGPDDDMGSPGLRLHQESHVKDPLEYGLYRIGEHGIPIRPSASSADFISRTGEPNSERNSAEVLDLGAFAVNSLGIAQRTNNEKRDIDARATPIIASYEARDRALAEGKSMEEAQAIGAEVYEVHFGMKGHPIITVPHYGRELPSPPPAGEHFSFTDSSRQHQQQRHQGFGRRPSSTGFTQAPPESHPGMPNQFEEAETFIHNMRVYYPGSVWLKEVSPEDMQKLIDEVKAMRAQMIADGVTEKKTQDARIYRRYRMNLETAGEHDSALKQSHGILWDLMGENPKGDIPF